MLHMNSAKRISIDVDIICEPGTNVIGYLNKTAQEYGFGEVVSGERVSRTNVPKTHANPSSHPRPPRLQPAPRLRPKPPTHPPKLKQKKPTAYYHTVSSSRVAPRAGALLYTDYQCVTNFPS